jgi:uncharacterized repeat protein (TIGR01451 family)
MSLYSEPMLWLRYLARLASCFFALALSLHISPALAASDFSDAPAIYGSAEHTIVAGISIGAQLDAETAAFASASANGDDTNGSDDEDGVTIGTVQRGAIATFTVSVSGTAGLLQAWIDWNGDGDWADAGEQIVTNVQDGGTRDYDGAVNGRIRVQALVPANAVTTTTYARFRWSTTSGLTSTATAADGEVEDYALSIQSEGATPTLNGCIGTSVSSHAPATTPPTTVTVTSPFNGTVTTGSLTGTFAASFTTNGFGITKADIGSNGIQFDMQNAANANPDNYQYSYTVTPDAGAGVNQVVVCQSPYRVDDLNNGSNIGNDEPNEMTLTWTSAGSAVIYDPNNQISSHANGATITSGTRLIFANSVPNGTGANGGGLSGPDAWAVIIPAPSGASPVTVTVTSVGCQTSIPSNFCHLMNTTSNTSGDRFREWISFDSRLAARRTVLNVTKSSAVPTNPLETTNHKAIPGATLRYCILVTNPGPGSATVVSFSDPLPTATTYVPGSIKVGTNCTTGLTAEDDNATGTDETDPVGASISSTTVQANLGTMTIGTSRAIVFDATLN